MAGRLKNSILQTRAEIGYGGDAGEFVDEEVKAMAKELLRLRKDRLIQWQADRAELEERARPIDAEWFRENGNDVCSIFVCRGDVEYEIEWAAGTPGVGIDLTVYSGPKKCYVHSIHLPHVVTEGQLLDLLRILKGGGA